MVNIPPDIFELLNALTEQFIITLQSNLVGIYLHGSLAMGGFNPLSSDIDFLVVVQRKLNAAAKQQIIDFILPLAEEAPTKGLEFSIILLKDLEHFIYPTPFELHFSNMWKELYKTGAVDFEKQNTDPDLAAHFVITRARGICLYGEPIERIFPNVPAEDYLQSIMGDAEGIFEDVTRNPVYSVLNLCRVMAYKHEGLIVSKIEGGEWALKHLDPNFTALITQALEAYQSQQMRDDVWSETALKSFGDYMRTQLE
jgi:predicted nucleotidyltransferase